MHNPRNREHGEVCHTKDGREGHASDEGRLKSISHEVYIVYISELIERNPRHGHMDGEREICNV